MTKKIEIRLLKVKDKKIIALFKIGYAYYTYQTELNK